MDGNTISYSRRPDGRRYFTNADIARMVTDGLIDPEDRWELIAGEWFDMPSEGFEHWNVRSELFRELTLAIGKGKGARVTSEGSVFFAQDTELRPDILVHREGVSTNHFAGTDILLVVEIMASSQHRDIEIKRPVYASAGVPELWLIDLEAGTVRVCRDPERETYRSEQVFSATEMISPLAFATILVSLAPLLSAGKD